MFPESVEVFVPFAFREYGVILFLIFYTIIGLGSRFIAKKYFPLTSKENEHLYSESEKKMMMRRYETYCRWPTSLIHAIMSACLITLQKLDYIPIEVAEMNMNAYFLIDSIIDQDFEYFLHHLSPMISIELMHRMGASIYHSTNCYYVIEIGNVFAHSAAIITLRSGKVFHKINTLSFWISRPISMVDMILIWKNDIPIEKRFTAAGLGVLVSVLIVYSCNIRWMIKMILPRKKEEEFNSNGSRIKKIGKTE